MSTLERSVSLDTTFKILDMWNRNKFADINQPMMGLGYVSNDRASSDR